MAGEGEQRGWAVQSRQHLAVSLRSATEEARLHQKSATHRYSLQAWLLSFQSPWAKSRQSRCQHRTARWEFGHAGGVSLDLPADCLSVRRAGFEAWKRQIEVAVEVVGSAWV
jgi:hypothetical protein